MPDPTKQTVSASQMPALLNISPYLTRWLLWRHFKHDDKIDAESSGPNDRMEWGKRMQPIITQAAAEEMNLEVFENHSDKYSRHPSLAIGATIDAELRDLNRGPGVLECKNVDWLQWRDNWTEKEAPDHIEAQLQAQMLATGGKWGTIAVLVGGNDLKLYHREPDLELHETMATQVAAFFASVKADNEPPPFGRDDELPLWRSTREYPEPAEPLDLTASRTAHELMAELNYWAGMKSLAEKNAKSRKAKLEVIAGEHNPVRAHGWVTWLKRSQTKASEVSLPMDLRQHLAGIFDRAEAGKLELDPAEKEALAAAISWSKITRRGGISVKLDIREEPTLDDPPWIDEDELIIHA